MPDRGPEMVGKLIELAGQSLGFNIANVAPYRPDLKGVVEHKFRLINDEVIDWQPGKVPKEWDRTAPDYRLDATYTLFRFWKLMINYVLHYNMRVPIGDYRAPGYISANGAAPYRIDLWNYGIEHIAGPHVMEPDWVHVSLLPRAKARATGHGLRLRLRHAPQRLELYYACASVLQDHRLVRGSGRDWLDFDVSYNPGDVSRIVVRDDRARKFEWAHLVSDSMGLPSIRHKDARQKILGPMHNRLPFTQMYSPESHADWQRPARKGKCACRRNCHARPLGRATYRDRLTAGVTVEIGIVENAPVMARGQAVKILVGFAFGKYVALASAFLVTQWSILPRDGRPYRDINLPP